MAALVNSSFASPIANADYTPSNIADGGLLSRIYNGMSGLSATITLLLVLVAYDQCELQLHPPLLPVTEIMSQLNMSGIKDQLSDPRGKCPL